MKTPCILLVDDDPNNIKLLKAILMREYDHLVDASNGEEVIERVAETRPDLILLDVMMPGIDGFEVCRRLKENEETKIIPILMVTSLTEKEHRVRAMEVGADDFLSKPVDQTELLIRVKSLLRIKSYHDELRESYREIAEKNERLEQLEEIRDGLIHMIIHDLKNPLMAISGNVELVMMEENTLSQKQNQRLVQCYQYCRELGDMIQNLLDSKRIEEGKLIPSLQATEPGELVDAVLGQFTSRIEEKQISLHFPKPDMIPSVRIDPGLIKRVIANLLGNAIRHTPEEGKIEIFMDYTPESQCLGLSVKDNGNGLSPAYREKIFDKFEQARLKSAGVSLGQSGLGLAFCKMAVEAHQGKIWVESDGEGSGSSFRFVVPAGTV